MARIDYYYDENAPKPNSIVPAASAVVMNEDGKILLHKRRDNKSWSLPGGAMEPGESIQQTIEREVLEETGYQVQTTRIIGVYTNPHHIIEYSNGEVRQQFSICFACKILGGELAVSDESLEVAFFDFQEIKELEIHDAQRVRIEDFLVGEPKAFIR